MPGIWTSRKTRSGRSRSMLRTASGPSLHSATTSMSGCSESIMRTRSRPSSSSSTIIVRIFGKSMSVRRRAVEWVIGDGQDGAGAALGPVTKLELVSVSVEVSEPGARCREPDSFTEGVVRQSRAVVADAAVQHVTLLRDVHVHVPAMARVLEAVTDRVLDERLQHEARHACIQDFRLRLHRDRESIAEAQRHDL